MDTLQQKGGRSIAAALVKHVSRLDFEPPTKANLPLLSCSSLTSKGALIARGFVGDS
jgi:hypothetical protein